MKFIFATAFLIIATFLYFINYAIDANSKSLERAKSLEEKSVIALRRVDSLNYIINKSIIKNIIANESGNCPPSANITQYKELSKIFGKDSVIESMNLNCQ